MITNSKKLNKILQHIEEPTKIKVIARRKWSLRDARKRLANLRTKITHAVSNNAVKGVKMEVIAKLPLVPTMAMPSLFQSK